MCSQGVKLMENKTNHLEKRHLCADILIYLKYHTSKQFIINNNCWMGSVQRDVRHFSVTRWKLCGAAPQVSFAETGVFRISFDPREVPVHPRVHARVIRQAASFAPRHHACNPHVIVFFLFDCIPTNNGHTSKSFI